MSAVFVRAMGSRPENINEYSEVSRGQLKYYIQCIVIQDSLGNNYGEFSYSMAINQLQFIYRDKYYQAGYSISIVIYNSKGEQKGGDSWERSIRIEDYKSLQSGDSIMTDVLLLPLSYGTYIAQIICRDDNSLRMGQFNIKLNVSPSSGNNFISGVRFEREYNGQIIPWPSRIYGPKSGPVIFNIRTQLASPESLKLNTSLADVSDQKIVWNKKLELEAGPGREIRTIIPCDSLTEGNYLLKAELDKHSEDKRWQKEYKIIINNPGNLTTGDFEDKIAQVEYISRRPEYDSLMKALPAQRDSLWVNFWKSRDPTPDTEKNEYRDQYYEKINYANNHYDAGFNAGWKTDMGRVYIKHDLPDEVEKHPFETNSQPYEIWYYYQKGFKIIFVDKYGFGEYKIYYTNKEI
jgi:GWxTD domain-containing protein